MYGHDVDSTPSLRSTIGYRETSGFRALRSWAQMLRGPLAACAALPREYGGIANDSPVGAARTSTFGARRGRSGVPALSLQATSHSERRNDNRARANVRSF